MKLLLALACLTLTSCFTITGTIDIPGGQGKKPIGTIGFSQSWPFTKPPVFTPVTPEPPLPQEGKSPVAIDPHWTPGAP